MYKIRKDINWCMPEICGLQWSGSNCDIVNGQNKRCQGCHEMSWQNSMTFPWFFHDCITKVCYLLSDVQQFYWECMTLPNFSENSMSFPEIPENVKIREIPWVFHDRGNPVIPIILFWPFHRLTWKRGVHLFSRAVVANVICLSTVAPSRSRQSRQGGSDLAEAFYRIKIGQFWRVLQPPFRLTLF